LSIVKAIVERHGGTISIDSRPGRTVFEMVLPRTSAPAEIP
jgi:two-component system OmpR family sensor kinase